MSCEFLGGALIVEEQPNLNSTFSVQSKHIARKKENVGGFSLHQNQISH